MNIINRERTQGGWHVTIEVPLAYTDGTSRFERVYLADAEIRGKSLDQARQAVKDAVVSDPLAAIVGEPVSAPPPTKHGVEDRMVVLYDRWLRWHTTRQEAVARAMPLPVITEVTAQEDAVWGDYVAALTSWRLLAP